MKKLIILPGGFQYLGGTVVSLSLLIQGFKSLNQVNRICVIVQANSITHQYLKKTGQTDCLVLIDESSPIKCMRQAFEWINQQPRHDPLLLDNWTNRELMPLLILESVRLRLTRRSVYHFCHDLCASNNYLGFLLRKLAFTCLSPKAICNSQFTANHIRVLITNIKGVLYQPVDTHKFSPGAQNIPSALVSIIEKERKILLTPSRLNKPGIVNDKNLRALIPVIAELKRLGHNYHGVIVGSDQSTDGRYSRELLNQAEQWGVADRLTILPSQIDIENFYPYASAVVTLAPREPFGRIVVEAISCGVPIIGSNTGGIYEILLNFAPDWAVNPDCPNLVAYKIIEVTNSLETHNTLLKAREWVVENCGIEKYASEILRIVSIPI
ncbi:glycosyltransferase family 4 protein [Nodosilinea sp. E11]|uniref:glycosyltransferase family 4 protein n=1 Tax=Nodosilinea sp. E11 TaxID=3037479 RepID=UPI0029345C4E|nr:glycosyltransferase family 4 protein [Nodosilinea sp. E11]WOD37413.1 glycosyltransferase family 4 protein [Nodosilinea sp. E11]